MREITFFNNNKNKWEEIDRILKENRSINPDQLSDLYIQLTDDLAYAQSNYPESNTTSYLNQLTSKVHIRIFRNKKERLQHLKNFWVSELPLLLYKQRKSIRISLIIFLVSCIIGAFSASKDDTFVRLILGDQYVNKTLENIEHGNPMGIYDSMNQFEMFLMITFNNIRVSFLVFAAGILFSIGAAVMLFYNGIMLGSFQYLFYAKNLFFISFATIWVHGTLEITSIVIAGGTGIALGNSFMFPGTYSRKVSFQRTARESVKIIIGLIPVFLVAGFIEGYITRISSKTTIPGLIIIFLSTAFVLFYFIFYPKYLSKKHKHGKN